MISYLPVNIFFHIYDAGAWEVPENSEVCLQKKYIDRMKNMDYWSTDLKCKSNEFC